MRRPRGHGFSRRAVGWIVGVAGGSFVPLILFTAFAGDLGDPVTAGSNAFSRSALGHAALVELLERLGLRVLVRRNPRTVPSGEGIVWIAAQPFPDWKERGHDRNPAAAPIEDASLQGAPLLLVLPKWAGAVHPAKPRWLQKVRLLPAPAAAGALEEAVAGLPEVRRRPGREHACETAWGSRLALELRSAQLFEPPAAEDWEEIVRCGNRSLVIRIPPRGDPGGRGGIYVVSDPDPMSNHGLGSGDAARFLAELLEHLGARQVVIDETIHDFLLSGGLPAELFRFPLSLLTAHAALLVGFVLWAGMGRFGKPAPGPAGLAPGKDVLIDNTAQLIGVAGRAAAGLPSIFWYTVRTVGDRYFLPSDLSRERLLERLGEIGRARGASVDVEGLLEEARLPRGRRASEEAVALARRLHRWRTEMTDVH